MLQDDFFNFMRAAGYTDVERGERGSTEEHLTVTQFKVQAEQQRLEAVTDRWHRQNRVWRMLKLLRKSRKETGSSAKGNQGSKGHCTYVQDIEAMARKPRSETISR